MPIPSRGEALNSESPTIGIYIHVPFCQRKCLYCDFYSEDHALERLEHWAEALLKEIALRLKQLPHDTKLATLYIGGGSPNLLTATQLQAIVKTIKEGIVWDSQVEFTLELNPHLLEKQLLAAMETVGVNRVSLGIQSLQEGELQTLGRLHNVYDCYRAVADIRHVGIKQLSLDLIYGIPGQTLATWQDSVRKAVDLQPDHLSLYNLTYEKGTPLAEALEQGKIQPVEDETEWQMYSWAAAYLNQKGYDHYEISNWAKPECYARHNRGYWRFQPYLGFGPAAHSLYRRHRFWNVSSIDEYIHLIEQNKLPIAGEEYLDSRKRSLEILMLKLRTSDGIAITTLERICQTEWQAIRASLQEKLGSDIQRYLRVASSHVSLTLSGWFVYNSIIKILVDLIKEQGDDNQEFELSSG